MRLLITGKLKNLSQDFYNQIIAEHRIIICGPAAIKSSKKREIIVYDEIQDGFENVFKSFNFDAVLYFSQSVDGTKRISDELEKLESALYYCEQYQITSFFYITTNDLVDADTEERAGSRCVLLKACEELCRNSSRENDTNIAIIRIPYLYSIRGESSQLRSWLESAVRKRKVEFPGRSNAVVDFLWEQDLAELVLRILDEPRNELLEFNIGGNEDLTFYELGKLIGSYVQGLKPEYLNYTLAVPKLRMENEAREKYGWYPVGNLEEMLPEMLDNIQDIQGKIERRKKRAMAGRRKLRETVEIGLEMLVLFIAAEGMNYVLKNNPQIKFLDFRLVFVIIIAGLRGLGAGVVAALLACGGYAAQALETERWQILFFNLMNWLPFATYFLLGSVLGYNRDKMQDTFKYLNRDKQVLENKYAFVSDLYMQTLQYKEELNNQIISYKDSFGKIYSVVKRLSVTLPEQVFMEAVNVIEELLDNRFVAIYSVDGESDYARLIVCSKNLNEELGKTLSLADYPQMAELVRAGESWINTDCLEGYPVYANGIFRDGRLAGLITLMHATERHMNREFYNKFLIIVNLVQSSLIRAMEYRELTEEESMIPGTRILNKEKFGEILEIKRQMAEKHLSEYMLLAIHTSDKSLSELSETVSRLVRNSDVIGEGEDGHVYLLLSQTKQKYLSIISKRLNDNRISYDIVA